MSLQTGQKLPDFELKDENGTTISNQTLVGQKVIISIYAQDDTPSCTKQVCSLNEDVYCI
jgi:thioredoxin-dependent peroxiredoxin